MDRQTKFTQILSTKNSLKSEEKEEIRESKKENLYIVNNRLAMDQKLSVSKETSVVDALALMFYNFFVKNVFLETCDASCIRKISNYIIEETTNINENESLYF